MYVTYRCEEASCRKKFPWNPSDGFPKVCPHCGFEPETIDDNVISLPAILSQKTKAHDAVAKQTMDGSSERALLASQMTGDSLADMNALKLTDLQNDGSALPAKNEVADYMAQHQAGGFNAPVPMPQGTPQVDPVTHTQQAMGLAAQAHTGRDHHAGARAMGSLQKALFKV